MKKVVSFFLFAILLSIATKSHAGWSFCSQIVPNGANQWMVTVNKSWTGSPVPPNAYFEYRYAAYGALGQFLYYTSWGPLPPNGFSWGVSVQASSIIVEIREVNNWADPPPPPIMHPVPGC